MNSSKESGDPDTGEPGHTAGTSQGKDRERVIRGKERRRREGSVIADEATVVNRESLASTREDALHCREDAAGVREGVANKRENTVHAREEDTRVREVAASTRERAIHVGEALQSAAEEQMLKLQQANARLIIATIDAHKLADELQTTKDQLAHLAHHDVLTGLPNRTLLQDRLNQAIELARRQGHQLAVMFMDLDQFKHINDSLGHAVGDQLLQSVAQRLVNCVRHSDSVSRLGGDEFVLVLPHIEHAEDAAQSAQKVMAVLASPHRVGKHELQIGVSIGISVYPLDGLDARALIQAADTAMYSSKDNGRSDYKFFDQGMNRRVVARQSTEASLRGALERQEFVLYYQPRVNLHTGAIVGVEALVRWQHPQQGMLLPAQFIPIAEDSGLILPIGRWVLRQACSAVQAWQQAGLPAIILAVNTSSIEFRAKDFFEYVRGTLAEAHLAPRFLELELTESVLMRDVESTNTVLQSLADLGVRLAVDDFGTGYSSLSYLSRFPIDTLKIDQMFVSQITQDTNDATIVSAVISLGKSLKQGVIAEGVESAEQYAFLLAHHCDEAQGYYFCPPVLAEEFAVILKSGIAKPAATLSNPLA